jgi:1,4-dihydroxy-2-naphthoate octaprenyltransferase
MERLAAWVQASRPLAQINIAGPLIYGQSLAYAAHGTFRWKIAGLVALFGIADQLFIVFANDAVDYPSDAVNRTFGRFSGGSRVIPEGKLGPMDLARASLIALVVMGGVSAYLALREQRAFMVVIAAVAAHLFWMYSFPPFRLSYRGQGEILQATGLGVVLPIAGFYAQSSTFTGLSPLLLVPAFLVGYAGNVTTALPDTPSDAATGKRSFPVRNGEPAAQRTSLALLFAAAILTPIAAPGIPTWSAVGIAVTVLAFLAPNLGLVSKANATNRSLCERFVVRNGAATQVLLLGWSASLVFLR